MRVCERSHRARAKTTKTWEECLEVRELHSEITLYPTELSHFRLETRFADTLPDTTLSLWLTLYGATCTATISFFSHHLRLISHAAVIGAALL